MCIRDRNKEDIKIDIKQDRLTVSGERKLENEKKEKNYHSVESYYGSFSRSFYLPDNIKVEKVEAEYKDGCLLYTSDAADDLLCVDLGGLPFIKKKKFSPISIFSPASSSFLPPRLARFISASLAL
eukprot:TRINITY_DN22797_c0_g1_i1.p1 TRINITY_DN22797_c0_g1~~TRINITY_DN22797_c0_g1_i1.p1  ORF type:complete len:126 (-),score=35.10 TRINITY_DN22797_c0_g1_i1:18-395(-)